MNGWLWILIVLGGILIVPMLLKYSIKAFFYLTIAASMGAFVGWLLDIGFDSFPNATIACAALGVIGLVGASLELWGQSSDAEE